MSVERTKALQVGTLENDFRAEKQSPQRLCRELVVRWGSSGWVAVPGTRGRWRTSPAGRALGAPRRKSALCREDWIFIKPYYEIIRGSQEIGEKWAGRSPACTSDPASSRVSILGDYAQRLTETRRRAKWQELAQKQGASGACLRLFPCSVQEMWLVLSSPLLDQQWILQL